MIFASSSVNIDLWSARTLS